MVTFVYTTYTLKIYRYTQIYLYIYIYIYIYIKQVKKESRLTPSIDDHKMRCVLKALQI